MSSNPLTHHEILRLVEPFSLAGRKADLNATDRHARRLAFKPTQHASRGRKVVRLHETMVLEAGQEGNFQLVRTVADPTGLSAMLRAEGQDLAQLISQVDRFDPQDHFREVCGTRVAFSYRLRAGCQNDQRFGQSLWPVFDGALARIGNLELIIQPEPRYDEWAQIELAVPKGDVLDVPRDFFAVLGRAWRPLVRASGKWYGSLRIAKLEPERTREAESKVVRTLEHLHQALAMPPAEFHSRFCAARWQVFFRRALPLMVCGAMVASVMIFRRLPEGHSFLRFLLFQAPMFMLIGYFAFNLPVFDIPGVPRPLRQEAWGAGRTQIRRALAAQQGTPAEAATPRVAAGSSR